MREAPLTVIIKQNDWKCLQQCIRRQQPTRSLFFCQRIQLIQEIDGIVANSYQYVLRWDSPFQRIGYWNRFGMPDGYLSRVGDYTDIVTMWWVDPQKDGELKRAMGDGAVTLPVGET